MTHRNDPTTGIREVSLDACWRVGGGIARKGGFLFQAPASELNADNLIRRALRVSSPNDPGQI